MKLHEFTLIFSCVTFGVLLGNTFAHGIISTECDRLGKFYVGKKVYECKQKITKEEK